MACMYCNENRPTQWPKRNTKKGKEVRREKKKVVNKAE